MTGADDWYESAEQLTPVKLNSRFAHNVYRLVLPVVVRADTLR
jgi:hypothetical protein